MYFTNIRQISKRKKIKSLVTYKENIVHNSYWEQEINIATFEDFYKLWYILLVQFYQYCISLSSIKKKHYEDFLSENFNERSWNENLRTCDMILALEARFKQRENELTIYDFTDNRIRKT